MRTNLFRGGDAVGQRIRIGDYQCDVIGTLTTRGQAGFGGDQDDIVIMPIKTVQRRLTGNRDVALMLVGSIRPMTPQSSSRRSPTCCANAAVSGGGRG